MIDHEPMSEQTLTMTNERLAEIRAHRDEADYAAENDDDMENDDPVILWQQIAADLTDALAEIERLQAQVSIMRPIVETVALHGVVSYSSDTSGATAWAGLPVEMIDKARAYLAAHPATAAAIDSAED